MLRGWGLLVCACAAVLQSSQSILIRGSRVDGVLPYHPITVTILSEAAKCAFCVAAILLGYSGRGPDAGRTHPPIPPAIAIAGSRTPAWLECGSQGGRAGRRVPGWLYYAPPALLYTIDNNIVYLILEYIAPSTLAVVWNVKIIFSATLLYLVLKRRFTAMQQIAIVLLLTGVATAESSALEGGCGDAGEQQSQRHMEMVGLGLAMVGAFVSSTSGVYTEWVLKREVNTGNFFLQNLQLYAFGILFNGLALVWLEADALAERGFFHGYSWRTWAIVLVASMGGMCSGTIFKFLGNIPSLYTHVASMFLTTLLSALLLGFHVTLTFACGFVVVAISLQLYYSPPATVLPPAPPVSKEEMAYELVSPTDPDVLEAADRGGSDFGKQ